MCQRYAMRIYTVHRKRVTAVAMAAGTLVLLVVAAMLHCPPQLVLGWSYGEGLTESVLVDNGTFDGLPPNGMLEEMDTGDLEPSVDDANEIGQFVGTYSDYDEYQSEDEEDNDENENAVFRDGDFDSLPPNVTSTMESETTDVEVANSSDSSRVRLSVASFAVVKRGFDRRLQGKSEFDPPATNPPNRMRRPAVHRNAEYLAVEDSIFWSKDLERLAPKGLTSDYVRRFQQNLRQLIVTGMAPPSWNRCGRPKNQYLALSDGSHVCARYRAPYNYLVQGEVMSFYLGRLLGLDNIPIVVLSKVDPTMKQWGNRPSMEQTVALRKAGWEVNTTVALIQWIEGLERSKMPHIILKALQQGATISAGTKSLMSVSTEQLLELLQWSDLIVFDYITGNYDRVASMQDAADKEQRPDIMQDTIHNLVRQRSTGCLWLLDNESGLLDSYSLMYAGYDPAKQGKRFLQFQRQMLHTMCIFRHATFGHIRFLHEHGAAHKLLLSRIHQEEPLFLELPDPTKNVQFVRHFQQRIEEVHRWMLHCQRQHHFLKDPV